jgi:uncharacterized repeat protein (TIGR03803 family)
MDKLFPGTMEMPMKTTKAMLGILTRRTFQTCAMTEPVSGRKLVLALPIQPSASGRAIVRRRRVMRLLLAAALLLPAFVGQAGVVLTTLHSFEVFAKGGGPYSELVQGSDGNFYGTTWRGGTNGGLVGAGQGGYGTVFKITTNAVLTSLYSFTGGNDGANPEAGLVQGSDGYFYGTTCFGGANGAGTVFKISSSGALTTLYSFTGGNDGGYPDAALVQGSDGNFYGTTVNGGPDGFGAVFKISATGAFSSLYNFTGGDDGGQPHAGLVQGSDGNFYGTTSGGFPWYNASGGTVFQISTNGALTTLYSFALSNFNNGRFPYAGLVQGSDGYFYGTTYEGGVGGVGTVFRLVLVRAAPVFQALTLTNGTLDLTWSTEAGGTYQLQFNSGFIRQVCSWKPNLLIEGLL